jgi:hypothetical protein
MAEPYDTCIFASSSAEALNLPINLGSRYSLPLRTQLLNVEAYRIKTVDVPRSFYTIKTGDLVFGLQGNVTGAQSIAIPAGNYTFIQLSSYIQTAWAAATATTITVSFTEPNFKVLITRTGGADATIAITATQLALAGMGSIMGFYSTIAAATTLTASNVFNINGPAAIYVCSAALNFGWNQQANSPLHNGTDGKFIRSDVIFQMPNFGNMGAFNNGQIPGEWMVFPIPKNISNLDFYLTDERGTEIQLNGRAWGISVEFRMTKGAN